MTKEEFYQILDIDAIDDFEYYENISNLMEDDNYIELDLIENLIMNLDKELISELVTGFFTELEKIIPIHDSELAFGFDVMNTHLESCFQSDEYKEENIAKGIFDFRKWFVLDKYVVEDNNQISIKDAIYNIKSSKLLNLKPKEYEFSNINQNLPEEYTIYSGKLFS